MSAPVRPEPDSSRPQQLRLRFERLVGHRADPAPLSRGLIALIAAGALCLTLGLLLGWQSWTNRSAVPIDDRLPYLDTSPDTSLDSTLDPSMDTTDGQAATPAGEPENRGEQEPQPAAAVDVVIHVAGAVSRPGVVSLPAGSRVYEAIDLAGGASRDADLDRVNLAAPVADGERIHVPEVGEEVPVGLLPPPPSASGLSVPPGPIDINAADVVELETLSGIGPSLAEAIVTTRLRRGPFRSVDELLEVPGIGEAKLAQLRDHIAVR